MRILVQRVSKAKVSVGLETIGEINHGLCVFVGIENSDSQDDIDWLGNKISNMRIFKDTDGKMNASLLNTSGSVLLISQFTLHASTKKGNRPSFIKAGRPDFAEIMYTKLGEKLAKILGPEKMAYGQFGAHMKVDIVNDGPVTIWLDSKRKE